MFDEESLLFPLLLLLLSNYSFNWELNLLCKDSLSLALFADISRILNLIGFRLCFYVELEWILKALFAALLIF